VNGCDPVLRLRGLRRTYDADSVPVRALRGVDLDVAAGELVALTGPSGCGKSTLLHVAAGLDHPDEGSVVLAGHELTTLTEDQRARVRRRSVGMVFQFFHLLDGMSALDNVALAAMAAGSPRRAAEARARDLLDLLGLLAKARSGPGALSGGQRQRLAIARALANRPALLLADEPTGALDSESTADVLGLLQRLNADGQAVLLVTHDAAVAACADRVVRMRDGLVLPDGEPPDHDVAEPVTVPAQPAARSAPR
jgi:putative ABC transport system ATP-binding protein